MGSVSDEDYILLWIRPRTHWPSQKQRPARYRWLDLLDDPPYAWVEVLVFVTNLLRADFFHSVDRRLTEVAKYQVEVLGV